MRQWSFRKLEVKGHMNSISASTGINTYGESFDVADLEAIAEEIVGTVINRNHFYFSAPVGRTVKAEIVPIENGQFALKTLKEFYIDPNSLSRGGFSVGGRPANKVE